jgi:hypothetical protein
MLCSEPQQAGTNLMFTRFEKNAIVAIPGFTKLVNEREIVFLHVRSQQLCDVELEKIT